MSDDLKPGFYPDMPAEIYHQRRLGVVSKSALDKLNKTPAHYYAWATGTEDEPTEAMNFGKAGHCAIFEPDVFSQEYYLEPEVKDRRTKRDKAIIEEAAAANPGKEPIKFRDWQKIEQIQKSIHSHQLVRKLISDGHSEASIVWRDSEYDLLCKSRVDHYAPQFAAVVDLKLVESAQEWDFGRSIARYRYHVQDALYRSGFAALGKPLEFFVFVAVEKSPPYASAVYSLDVEGVAKGHLAARRDIQTMAQCLRDNSWPGYPTGVNQISVPDWAA